MRRFGTWVIVAALVVGCGQAHDEAREEFTNLQRGEATVRCRDGDDYPRRPVTDVTSDGLNNLLSSCDANELVIFYEGEIDRSFAQMVSLISDRHWPYARRTLFLHSPGGEVEAALQAGAVMSQEPWAVYVARTGEISLTNNISTARCYSACVFVLAAARERLVQGEVGIHRIYPSGSDASSREELQRELEAIVDRTKAFLRQNGVSTSIVDDMMSVPSNDIRTLTQEDLDRYGLGPENAAQVDVERLDLDRRCGSDFLPRLEAAEQEIAQICGHALSTACLAGAEQCSAASAEMDTCSNAVNRNYGFPDPVCPRDGPSFYCESGRIAKSCDDVN